MTGYLGSRWVKFGIILFSIDAAPLMLIIVAAAVGLWPDPNRNPVGPGLLFFFTFWPAIACILTRSSSRARSATRAPETTDVHATRIQSNGNVR